MLIFILFSSFLIFSFLRFLFFSPFLDFFFFLSALEIYRYSLFFTFVSFYSYTCHCPLLLLLLPHLHLLHQDLLQKLALRRRSHRRRRRVRAEHQLRSRFGAAQNAGHGNRVVMDVKQYCNALHCISLHSLFSLFTFLLLQLTFLLVYPLLSRWAIR